MQRNTYRKFWDKVQEGEPDECWLWTGPVNKSGYGILWAGDLGHTTTAHRYSYWLENDLTPGMQIHHTCFNIRCVNPSHLKEVTRQENMRQSPRVLSETCKRGHPRTTENTYKNKKNGRLNCRVCRMEAYHQTKES